VVHGGDKRGFQKRGLLGGWEIALQHQPYHLRGTTPVAKRFQKALEERRFRFVLMLPS
jgi:hypothetical protein